ncbi:DUF1672 family protein [Listeria sp. ILCC797]|uniref:DUF1672 family protein n=1 Tax=Listeria sp. ILCC797 TaxID=1918333 RepID=UPI000B594616|nr:DUF1672 family protein [Listeria sp. ILCC797]
MKGKKIAISIIGVSILLGGCSFMGQSDEEEKKVDDGTTPVAEYEGQGFIFVDGDKSKDIVEKNEAEIKKRAIKYMKDTYKTDVKVNNVVPARDAAVVMVEAEEPIEFHTSVIVGLDMQKKELDPPGSVRSEEGKVEFAIQSALYEKAYTNEFNNLDTLTNEMAEKYRLQGYNSIAFDKTQSVGGENKFFFVSVNKDFNDVLNAYLDNPYISSEEVKKLFSNSEATSENINIVCRFFNIADGLPEQKTVNQISDKIKETKNLPSGTYLVDIYKNFIVDRVGLPDGESTSADEFQK